MIQPLGYQISGYFFILCYFIHFLITLMDILNTHNQGRPIL